MRNARQITQIDNFHKDLITLTQLFTFAGVITSVTLFTVGLHLVVNNKCSEECVSKCPECCAGKSSQKVPTRLWFGTLSLAVSSFITFVVVTVIISLKKFI